MTEPNEHWMKRHRSLLVAALLLCALSCVSGVGVPNGQWGGEGTSFFNTLGAHLQPTLGKVLFEVGGQPVRVLFVIKTLLYLCFLFFVARFVERRSMESLSGKASIDLHHRYILSKVAAGIVYFVGICIGIWMEKIDLTTLTIVGGTLGVAIGVGFQGVVSNFIAGLILLFDQTIRLGDRIEIGGRTGKVVRVGPRNASIRTDDNVLILVPNSEFISKQNLNWTAGTEPLRIAVTVPVPYGEKHDEVKKFLLQVADEHPDALKAPAPSVILTELRPQAVLYSLRVWTRIPAKNIGLLQSDLNIAILGRLQDAGIRMPAVQLDYNL
jgi:small-conductance mechanosensitive channel